MASAVTFIMTYMLSATKTKNESRLAYNFLCACPQMEGWILRALSRLIIVEESKISYSVDL